MPVLEIGLAFTIAKVVCNLWLPSPVAQIAASSLLDVINSRLVDASEKRAALRQFESIADKISKEMRPIFEQSGYSEQRQSDIEWFARETINQFDIVPERLFELDFDASLLAEALIKSNPGAGKQFSFSVNDQKFYERVLFRSSSYIIDFYSGFLSFKGQSVSEILSRESQIMTKIEEILEKFEQIRKSGASKANDESGAFEGEYREGIIRKLDKMELIGLELTPGSQSQNLSIAYVSLSGIVEMGSEETVLDDDRGSQSEFGGDSKTGESDDRWSTVSIEQTLSNNQKLLICGDAGSGKTTILRWIAVQSAAASFSDYLEDWNGTTPFYLPLRQFVESGFPAPQDFLLSTTPQIAGVMPEGWVHQRLRSGRAIVLIDGVDEIPIIQRPILRAWLKDLTETFGNSKFVVSSRPTAIQDDWLINEGFTRTDVQPMELADVDIFIERWHSAVRDQLRNEEEISQISEDENHLKEEIRSRRPIRNLATNPLLCAVICALHRDRRQQLPADRIQLYDACCDLLMERRDIERQVHRTSGDYPSLTLRQKKVLLEDLAHWMMRNSLATASIEKVDDQFGNRLRNFTDDARMLDGKDVRRLFLDRSGMIREPVANQIDFAHRTFQEFLAARGVLDLGDTQFLINNATDDQWRETIILAAGVGNSRERRELINGLIDRGDNENESRHQLHMLAVACLETAVELPEEMRKQVLSRLADLVPPSNLTEAKALASAGNLAVPYLGFSQKLNRQQASACVRALGLIGGEEALKAIGTYRGEARQAVLKELFKAEDSFDLEEYRAEILSSLSPHRLDLSRSVGGNPDCSLLLIYKNLSELNISKNRLVSLPVEILDLQNLSWLNASENLLENLPNDFSDLINLISVELNHNKFSEFPAPLLHLKNLRRLVLWNNDLKSLPSEIGMLTGLQTLDLDANKIGNIAVIMVETLGNLGILWISRNELESLPAEVGNLHRLRTLYAHGNRFKYVPPSIGDLTRLTRLNFSSNLIENLPVELFFLKNLRYLHISNNKLKAVPSELGRLNSLIQLDLGGNELTSIPSEIGKLKELRSLDLRDNQITALPREIGSLINLQRLELSGNPLSWPPMSVIDSGVPAILEYVRSSGLQ